MSGIPPEAATVSGIESADEKEKNILIIHTKNISKRSKSIQPVKIQYILYKFYQRCMSCFTIKSPYKSIRH